MLGPARALTSIWRRSTIIFLAYGNPLQGIMADFEVELPKCYLDAPSLAPHKRVMCHE